MWHHKDSSLEKETSGNAEKGALSGSQSGWTHVQKTPKGLSRSEWGMGVSWVAALLLSPSKKAWRPYHWCLYCAWLATNPLVPEVSCWIHLTCPGAALDPVSTMGNAKHSSPPPSTRAAGLGLILTSWLSSRMQVRALLYSPGGAPALPQWGRAVKREILERGSPACPSVAHHQAKGRSSWRSSTQPLWVQIPIKIVNPSLPPF